MKKFFKFLKIHIRQIFIWCSVAFISFMVIYYGYRLVHFYVKEHKPNDISYSMIGYLTDEDNLVQNRLLKDGDSYYFREDATNNYLLFSGILYRILYLDSNSLYLISDEPVTSLKYGYTGDYSQSNVKSWLANVFLKDVDRTSLTSDKVYLLNKELYQKVGANKSYLIGEPFWIADDNQGFIIDADGDIKATNNYEDFLGIRPIIELNGYKAYISGNGKENNPYVVQDRQPKTLNDLYIGEYVKYNEQNFRVVSKKNQVVKLLKLDKLDEQHIFSKKTNVYGFANKDDLGYYLNNTYLSALNKDDLAMTKWNIGDYHLDYNEVEKTTVNSYVGLLSIGDYFITSVPNSYLLNMSGNNIYSISKDSFLATINYNNLLDIYPVISLKTTLEIKEGKGTINNPYVVGGNNE